MTITTNIKQNNLSIVLALAITTLMSIASILLLTPTKVAAATITPDGTTCTLDEAVGAMNAATDQNGCVATGPAYGTDDTISLSAGSFTYTNASSIEVPLVVQGAGMGETIIDCGGNNEGFFFYKPGLPQVAKSATVQDLSIINPDDTVLDNRNAIGSNNFNMTIRRVEVYANTNQEVEHAISVQYDIDDMSSTIEDIYVHNISTLFGAITVFVREGVTSTGNIIRQATVSDITVTTPNGSQAIGFGAYDNGGSISGSIENATFGSIDTPNATNTTYIIAVADSTISGGDGSVDVDVRNITAFGNPTSGDVIAPIVAAALAPSGGSADANIDFQNVLGAHVTAAGGTFMAGAGGTETTTINSLGGNIVDGVDPANALTHPTDQTEVTGLADTLGSLSNNGGSVPTMALLPGNPAIDGGVCGEGVPSTDARGITRPQGTTCDSGAFEVEQAASTGTVAGDTAVALNVPTGVVVNEFSTVSGSIPADNQGDAEYEFPLGLLSFELGVVEGSANEISLDFESDLDPESVVARKYNPSDQTYTTLENAVVTKITKDNQPTLRLTYTITDGTFPDLDNQANGTIIDPIGLATEKKGVLANTGDLIILAIPIGLSLLLGAFIVTYIDYRKHKKPLQEADQELAKTYTYWHHLKTVTIPLFSYRLSFGFEAKRTAHA